MSPARSGEGQLEARESYQWGTGILCDRLWAHSASPGASLIPGSFRASPKADWLSRGLLEVQTRGGNEHKISN